MTESASTPGATLRAARERAGLSLDEVAVQTKIALPLLEAIERDDLARLGQPVYARGYLRRYARAMNVAESEVLVALETREAPKGPPPATSQIAQEQVEGPSGGSRPMFWLLLVIVAAAIIGGAVLQLRGTKLRATSQPAPAPPVAAPAAAPAPVEAAPETAEPPPDVPPGDVEAEPAAAPAPASEVTPAPAAATPTQDETPAANPPPVEQPEPGAVAPTPSPQ